MGCLWRGGFVLLLCFFWSVRLVLSRVSAVVLFSCFAFAVVFVFGCPVLFVCCSALPELWLLPLINFPFQKKNECSMHRDKINN